MSHGAPFPTAPADEPWWRAVDPRSNLPLRVALGLIGGVAVFAALTVWLAGSFLRRQIEAERGREFATVAAQTAEKLDRALAERSRELQFVSHLTAFRAPAATFDERRRLLQELLDTSPGYTWLGFANAAGRVVGGTGGEREGETVIAQSWFFSGRSKPFAASVPDAPGVAREADGSVPPPYVALATPVIDLNGKFLGVLGARVSWARTVEMPAAAPVPGIQPQHLNLTVYNATGDLLFDTGDSGWTAPPPSPVAAQSRVSRGFFAENLPDGGRYVTGFARSRGFRDFQSLGWVVAVREPAGPALAPAGELERRIMEAGAAVAVLAGVLGWSLTARLTRRFRAVGSAAQRISGDDITALLPRPRGHGELPTMCAHLGEMVGKFRGRQEQLEIENARLRAQLHARDKPPAT